MPGIVAPPGYPEELTKYAKMMKMGVPEAAVRGKMATDGFDDDMYDKYLNPDTAITVGQQLEEDIIVNDNGDEENKEQVDILNPDQPESNIAQSQSQSQQEQKQESSQGSGFFASQSFVPPADSELKMDTLQPVPVKKTLLIVNTFVVQTAAFLNKFVTTCESKLHKIHTDIQRMETTMLLLESKLGSIDWLRQAEKGQAPVIPKIDESWETTQFNDDSKEQNDINTEQKDNNNGDNNNGDNNNGDDNNDNGDNNNNNEEPQEPAQDPLLSDENMKPWFKMLKFGVPAPAVRGKMSREGIDDDTIDRVIQIHNSR